MTSSFKQSFFSSHVLSGEWIVEHWTRIPGYKIRIGHYVIMEYVPSRPLFTNLTILPLKLKTSVYLNGNKIV